MSSISVMLCCHSAMSTYSDDTWLVCHEPCIDLYVCRFSQTAMHHFMMKHDKAGH